GIAAAAQIGLAGPVAAAGDRVDRNGVEDVVREALGRAAGAAIAGMRRIRNALDNRIRRRAPAAVVAARVVDVQVDFLWLRPRDDGPDLGDRNRLSWVSPLAPLLLLALLLRVHGMAG